MFSPASVVCIPLQSRCRNVMFKINIKNKFIIANLVKVQKMIQKGNQFYTKLPPLEFVETYFWQWWTQWWSENRHAGVWGPRENLSYWFMGGDSGRGGVCGCEEPEAVSVHAPEPSLSTPGPLPLPSPPTLLCFQVRGKCSYKCPVCPARACH